MPKALSPVRTCSFDVFVHVVSICPLFSTETICTIKLQFGIFMVMYHFGTVLK